MTYQLSLTGMSQTERTSDDYYTPKWIFDKLGLTFDLDPSCPPEGPINVPTRSWYTVADDGLSKPWHGRIWLNPPYSRPAPWVTRFIEHGHGIALLPVMTNGKWLHELWGSNVRLTLLTRIKFDRLDGQVAASYPGTIALWALGEECIEAISKFGPIR